MFHREKKAGNEFVETEKVEVLRQLENKSTRSAEKIKQLEKVPSAPKVKSKARVKRIVWKNTDNKCSHCGSTHALEIDHVVPKAMGGDSSPENLRLLCRYCNQRSAIEHFGVEKMAQHLMWKRSHRLSP